MNEDITAIEESTKRERIEKIYNKYKKLIYIFIFTILTLSISIYFYIDFKKKTKREGGIFGKFLKTLQWNSEIQNIQNI